MASFRAAPISTWDERQFEWQGTGLGLEISLWVWECEIWETLTLSNDAESQKCEFLFLNAETYGK